MTKAKKELLSSAPWRGEDDQSEKFPDAKLKVTRQPGQTPTMHVPRKKTNGPSDEENDESALDPELRYSFQRNYKVRYLLRLSRISSIFEHPHSCPIANSPFF